MLNVESESASSSIEHPARWRVLVADDNADMRQYVARLLSERYCVESVADGEAALDAVRRHRPDVILSDVMMPNLDGFGLLHALRNDPATKTIPVILLSARAGEESRVEGWEHGADDYLVKPFGARELLARVGAHLAMARVRKEAQAEIDKGKRFLERIADTTPDMLFVYDLVEERNIYINRTLESILGYKAGSLPAIVDPAAQFVHPDDLPAVRAWEADCRTMVEGEIRAIEYRARHRDGTYLWILARATAFERTEDGRVKQIIGVATDVTHRKRQEMEIVARSRQQSRLYEFADAVNRAEALGDLYEKALDTIIPSLNADRASILLFDDDGVMRFKAWRGLSDGYRRAVEGHSPWRADSADPRAFAIADIAASDIEPRLRAVLQEEGIRALAFVPLMYGGRLIGKFMLYFNRPYALTEEELTLSQTIAGTLALGIERKTAELRLRESEERFRTAFEWASAGMAQVDVLTKRFIAVNERYCRMTGYSRQELLALTPHDLTHPDDRDADVRRFAPLLRGDIDRFVTEKRYVKKDGAVIWVLVEVGLIRDAQGRPRRTIAIILDITARKEAQARLEHFAEELEGQVAARTHELLGSQERLRALATELNLAEQRERQRLATELHDHLQQMLVLGKLKVGQGKRLAFPLPACVEVMKQIDGMLSEALEYTRSLVADLSPPVLRDHGLPAGLKWLGDYMKKHDLSVTVNVPEQADCKLPEDQVVLLFQSVRELLINSWKHAGTGQATVTLEQHDAYLRIEVRDEGAGFDLAAAAAAAGIHSNAGISSKFGLFSIRERMRALGGSFDIQSAPGKGTRATLTLPLRGSVRDERDARDKREEKDSLAKPGRPVSQVSPFSPVALAARIRVLLVDDHAMVRQGLRTLLESYADVEVVGEASDGGEALAAVERWRPSVVVMDINMPKMNGIEATARITARFSGIAVIGLSVNAAGENQEAMKTAGAAILLTKEAAVDQLYQAMQVVLAGK